MKNDTLSLNDTKTESQRTTPPPSTVIRAHSLLWLEITLYAVVLFGEAASRSNTVAGLIAAVVAIAFWGCIAHSLLKGSGGRLILSVLAPFVLLFAFGYGLSVLLANTPIQSRGNEMGAIPRFLGMLNVLRGILYVSALSLAWHPASSAWYREKRMVATIRKDRPSGIERAILPVGRSYVAVIAGYLGLLSLTLWVAPVSLIVGFLALKHIKNHPGKTGKGRAWFAVVMGALFTVVLVIVGGRDLLERAKSHPTHRPVSQTTIQPSVLDDLDVMAALPKTPSKSQHALERWRESDGIHLCFSESLFPSDYFDEREARPLALTSAVIDSLMKSKWNIYSAKNPSKARGLPLRLSCTSSFECRDGSKPITPFYCSPTRSYPAKSIPDIRILPSFTVDIGTIDELPEDLLPSIHAVEIGDISREEFNEFRTSFLRGTRLSASGSKQCVDVGFAKTKFGVSLYVTTVDAADDFAMIGTQFFIPVSNATVLIPQIAVASFSTKGTQVDPPLGDYNRFIPVGLKFLSGLSLLDDTEAKNSSVVEQTGRDGQGNTIQKAASNGKPDFDETILCLSVNFGMPKPWTGETEGASWECDDYYFVFETHPKTVVESGVLTLDEETKNRLSEVACEIEYHHALFVYYKPGKNPSGEDSVRPCRILTIETTKMEKEFGLQSPFLCAFLPSKRLLAAHINYGHCPGARKEQIAREKLLEKAKSTLELKGKVIDLGPAHAVHQLLGKTFEKTQMKGSFNDVESKADSVTSDMVATSPSENSARRDDKQEYAIKVVAKLKEDLRKAEEDARTARLDLKASNLNISSATAELKRIREQKSQNERARTIEEMLVAERYKTKRIESELNAANKRIRQIRKQLKRLEDNH